MARPPSRRRMPQFEKSRVLETWRRGMIGMEAYQQLMADIDARLLALEPGTDSAAPPSSQGDVKDEPGPPRPGGDNARPKP